MKKVNAELEQNETRVFRVRSRCKRATEVRAIVMRRERMWEDRGRLRGTDRCFVRQLLCLYPLPHFSHLSSLPLVRLASPLDRREPSLARRIRDLEFAFSCSDMEAMAGPSVSASLLAASR